MFDRYYELKWSRAPSWSVLYQRQTDVLVTSKETLAIAHKNSELAYFPLVRSLLEYACITFE